MGNFEEWMGRFKRIPCYSHFYEIFMFGLYEKKELALRAESCLHEDGISLKRDVF